MPKGVRHKSSAAWGEVGLLTAVTRGAISGPGEDEGGGAITCPGSGPPIGWIGPSCVLGDCGGVVSGGARRVHSQLTNLAHHDRTRRLTRPTPAMTSS